MSTPNALVDELEAISKTFVSAIVAAMRRASLADILGVEGGAPPVVRGPGRPSIDAAGSRVDLLVAYTKNHPGTTGLAARRALGLPAAHWATYVSRAVNRGKLRKEGRGQGAKYWAI